MRVREWLDLIILIMVVAVIQDDAFSTTVGFHGQMTWMEAFKTCRNKNLTLASPRSHFQVNRKYPEWTFGLLVTRYFADGGQESINLESRLETETAVQCCSHENISMCKTVDASITGSFEQASNSCRSENSSLSFIEAKSAFGNSRLGNSKGLWFWAMAINVSSFFSDRNISVLCLLNDGSGKAKLENCNRRHAVICQRDEYKPVFYLPKFNVSVYDRFESTASGTSAKPSDASFIPTEVTGSSTAPAQSTEYNITNPLTTVTEGNSLGILPPDVVYLIVGVGVFVVLTMFVVAVCCCCCRRKRARREPAVMFEAYSDAVDSITLKDDQNLNSVYAVPDDAIRKQAKPRTSITEEEYDVLGKTDKPDRVNTGNVYSHITMGTNRKKHKQSTTTNTTDIGDETYDVTSRNKTASLKAKGREGDDDTYEELGRPTR